MENIWIIGAGKFGLRAAKWLMKQERDLDILMVDRDRASLVDAQGLGCRTSARDGIDFLCSRLTRGAGPDWVVPAVPVHLAWEWCRRHLGRDRAVSLDLPQGIKSFFPNPMDGPTGDIYVSHADFICPPNCNEPDDRCTKTGKPRKPDMFRILAEVDWKGIVPFVIQSQQLGPGVGGYRPSSLFQLRDRVAAHCGPFFVATACRCHGVVSGGRMIG
ncbi:MAG: potassium transporter [Desulfobacter sp.]|nr:MAG: potassium transporter [Desulfobacter sp.]